MLIFVIIASALICGFIGAWAGETKGRQTAGFWLGLGFGPLGWITVLLMDRPPTPPVQPYASPLAESKVQPADTISAAEDSMRAALRASRGN